MFRITRGIHIQHGPAHPSPALRFPDGTPIPIYVGAEDEVPSEKPAQAPAQSVEEP